MIGLDFLIGHQIYRYCERTAIKKASEALEAHFSGQALPADVQWELEEADDPALHVSLPFRIRYLDELFGQILLAVDSQKGTEKIGVRFENGKYYVSF